MRLILLGPPGAGKGTQAKLLAKRFHIPHISTGDILRDQMRASSTLGKKVAGFVKSGELVPDEIVIEVVKNRLAKADAKCGFILDGFPRTLNQAEKLTTVLKQFNIFVDLILYFGTSPSVSIERLSGRRVCKSCGRNFHLINMPPELEGICDSCGSELYLRDDDKEKTVKKRLAIYQSQTTNLINHYKATGKLREISGDSEAEKVFTQLVDMFGRESLN
ncbi:MAG: adenylate kinase [Omnitrophica bacterium]|nr:adenylate kinase [Candidatus Omnitrophota bacterium]